MTTRPLRWIAPCAAILLAVIIWLPFVTTPVAIAEETEVLAKNAGWLVQKTHGKYADYCSIVSAGRGGHGMSIDLWGRPPETVFVVQDPRFKAKTGMATILTDNAVLSKDVGFESLAPTAIVMHLPDYAINQILFAGTVQVKIINGPTAEFDMTGASEMMIPYVECLRSVGQK